MELQLHTSLNQDPKPSPVSGAYIRTLVNNLRTKEQIPINNPNSSSKMAENQNPQPHKKQVRRRLHTTRPYQERLLNMAEARREIVTALKYHRAAMRKAAGEPSRQEQTPPEPPARSQISRARKIPKSSSAERNRIYPNLNSNCNNINNNNNNNNNNNMKNLCYPSMNYSFPCWTENNLEIVLPEQTLGLNLNLKDFNNLEGKSVYSNGSVSGGSCSSSSVGGGGMHVAVGEEEMAEIRSIGEKHEMEWSDKMSMVKSAWWLRFMKMGKFKEEEEEEDQEQDQQEFGFHQILEFPDWINDGNQNCFQEQLFTDYHFFPPASANLPCMDIGEFEGMDGEWLA